MPFLLIGWATGGIVFGMTGDRWGRAKTMLLTILVYSLFPGLSAVSVTVYDFCLYRFLTGAGSGRRICRGRYLGGRGDARPCASPCLGTASGGFGNRQRDRIARRVRAAADDDFARVTRAGLDRAGVRRAERPLCIVGSSISLPLGRDHRGHGLCSRLGRDSFRARDKRSTAARIVGR
ncbi:MAG: MFS transporter [Rhodopirellula sp.]|nr:MFS transporter [Rhodopirellula sp.]